MNAIQALNAALALATPDWCVAAADDPDNHGGEHVEVLDAYGRTATVYGPKDDPETMANANLMALSRRHMVDLLEAVKALGILREAYLNEDPKLLEIFRGVLAGDIVTELMERLSSGEQHKKRYRTRAFDANQQVVVDSYNGGDHCAHSPADIRNCGDTLLTFLLIELSEKEDCDSFDCAIDRLDSAIRQLRQVRDAFEVKTLA